MRLPGLVSISRLWPVPLAKRRTMHRQGPESRDTSAPAVSSSSERPVLRMCDGPYRWRVRTSRPGPLGHASAWGRRARASPLPGSYAGAGHATIGFHPNPVVRDIPTKAQKEKSVSAWLPAVHDREARAWCRNREVTTALEQTAGEEAGRDIFVERLRPLLPTAHRLAYGMLHDGQEAEDAVAPSPARRKYERQPGQPGPPPVGGKVPLRTRRTPPQRTRGYPAGRRRRNEGTTCPDT